jgi:hypothetical protein
MTPDQARSEIAAIERDGRFAGKEADSMGFLDRKRMIDRRLALYEKAGPADPERANSSNPSMYDDLKRSMLDRIDPSCLTAGRPSIPCGKEVLHG